MMTVDIWSFEVGEGKHMAGSLTLEDGKITMKVTPGFENLMASVWKGDSIRGPGGGRVHRDADPEGWLQAIPYKYRGTYQWASLPHD
jgi:hypothetical protein